MQEYDIYTRFRTKYNNRPTDVGETGFSPTITQPDLAFSVEELVTQFSTGSLPNMAMLQPWINDSYDIDDTSNDLGFGGDKAKLLEDWLSANEMRRDIFERCRARYAKGKKENPDFTIKDATVVDGIDLENV